MTAEKLGDNFFYVDGFEKSRFWPGVLRPSLALASAFVHDFAKSYNMLLFSFKLVETRHN